MRCRFCGGAGFLALACFVLLPAAVRGQVYYEDFTGGDGGYTVTNGIGAGVPDTPWIFSSGTWFTNGAGNAAVVNSALDSPLISVPSAGKLSLGFAHRYDFEDDGTTLWDGGQVQVSVNGSPFKPVIAQQFIDGGYRTDKLILGNSPPLTGQYGFASKSLDYDSGALNASVANLGAFSAGDTLQLRFMAAWDECCGPAGPQWQIGPVAVEYDNSLPDLPPDRPANLTLDLFHNVGGVLISDLANHPGYPDTPDATEIVSGSASIPLNRFENYGAQAVGVFHPGRNRSL